jgi:hypothetical protein
MPKQNHAMLPLLLTAAIALASCNNSSTPSPNPTSTPNIANISGDYTGTTQDTKGGAGTATATLTQTGSSAGGAITITQTSGALTAQIALTISSSNAVKGSMVIDYPDGTTCTFSTTGTYTNNGTNSAVLSGSYTAVTNCAGDTGTYTLNQQCTDTVTSGERRIDSFPVAC